jgi:glycosyltransferase involved in cell wall biosynthesis
MNKKSILFINLSSGYLMVDIINAHVPYYDEIVLLTGFLNPREAPLNAKVRVKTGITYQRSSSIKRLLTWFVFWLQSLYLIFFKYRKHQLYFVSNPPLNTFTARWLKRDLAFLVYDIYPEALAQHNIISKESWFYKYWEASNQKLYKKAKHLFTLSQGMASAMKVPESENHKLRVVPVWTNNDFFKEIPSSKNKFLKKLKLKDKFIVSYSGNLGKTHPVEKVFEMAEQLAQDDDILFLIIGEGDKKSQLVARQKERQLPNLKILDFQPTELFPHVLAAVNVGVVTLESDAADLSVPSKTFNLMSAAKPILSIANRSSELAHIIKTNAIGENFSEDELKKMCDFILKLKTDPEIYQSMQKQSKKTSLKYSSKNAKQMIFV